MKQEILLNIDNPTQLEKLYRSNKTTFKNEFNSLYPELTNSPLADFWHERLQEEKAETTTFKSQDLRFIIIASLIAGMIANLHRILNIEPDLFFQRNLGFIVLPLLSVYFIWKNKLSSGKTIVAFVATLLAVVFINLLPVNDKSDTLTLACIHLPIFLWMILGFCFAGNDTNDYSKRLGFLRFNGDFVVFTAILLISGGILTGVSVGLFEIIGINLRDIHIEYIISFGLPSALIVSTYVVQEKPQLVNMISPLIAKIFSPLVLVTLVIYLSAIITTGKDPYNDREFLMTFNVLIIGVMAIIFFSVAETANKNETQIGRFILLALSTITVIINGIALSAILFRISEWGITPNRIAVLGANILMLANLLNTTFRLFKSVSSKSDIDEVENSIAKFLPVYAVWIIIVTFIFPFLFGFK